MVRSGWKCKLSNGPPRAQSKVYLSIAEYSVTWRHTSVAGSVKALRREHGSDHEIKVAPRVTLVLDRNKFSIRDFFYAGREQQTITFRR